MACFPDMVRTEPPSAEAARCQKCLVLCCNSLFIGSVSFFFRSGFVAMLHVSPGISHDPHRVPAVDLSLDDLYRVADSYPFGEYEGLIFVREIERFVRCVVDVHRDFLTWSQ